MQDLTDQLANGDSLSLADIRNATEQILDESVSVDAKVEFLSALSRKGETAEEIAGFASEFLDRAVDPQLDTAALNKPVIDVCGTGGDKLDLFNVSTTSVFVLAGAGVAVVKHGNRGITSKSGGADVLEALGIRIDLPPEDFARCVAEVGAGFLFAPLYHPAFKAVVPVRKILAERGQRTIFNLLGPLLNPTRPEYQLIGVFDPAVGGVFADILNRLGRKRAWAVHGLTETGAGMDEFSTLGKTHVWSSDPEDSVLNEISADSLGFDPATVAELRGGEAAENAAILTGILDGSITGAKRDIVTMNAAAALVVCGKAENLSDGLTIANESINSGAAGTVLQQWKDFS